MTSAEHHICILQEGARDEIWERVSQRKRKENRKVKRREESSCQSQDVMTIFVFYCHITYYHRLLLKIAYNYYLIVSIGQKSRHNFAGFSSSGF